MKVKIGTKLKDYRTVWLDESVVKMIDQPSLPHEFRIHECKTYEDTANAIRTMIVRGAPAIGASACYGMAQAALQGEDLREAESVLSGTRPTAYDLFDGISYFKKNYKDDAAEVAGRYAEESVERCRLIGVHGGKLIEDGMRLLTHCNAGALGCVDWGTALAPMRVANNNGEKIFVYVDETRPRCQGSRLTSWELYNEDIEHRIIADNAAGFYMRRGEIDLCIVGADRIAANGDVANKIGTYEKAVLAKENSIPFYVAAPSSTIDLGCESGLDIPIEERAEEEVLSMWGYAEGKIRSVRIAGRGCRALNPAFDVTPAKYVTGIITESGILKPKDVKKIKR
ncbi:MAG: S-methyl-5-thioribose-1-phosphate isomerase [Candidatus Altiarchaeota archaeon]